MNKAAVAAGTGSAVLLVLSLTQFLMTVDTSVMNVSIGALVDDLDTSVSAIQGVITTYTLVMAASMITGAKIGDLIGRRRALRIGLVIYAAGSAITAIAPNVLVLLIGWSVLEGLGAALIMPTVIALVAGTFKGRERALAYATLATAAAVAVAAGPIIGGFVTATFTWRLVFAVEVLIAAGILVSTRVIKDVPASDHSRLDVVGAALSASGLALLVFGVLQSGSWGWIDPAISSGSNATPQVAGLSLVIWLIGGGLLTLWVFTVWERHMESTGGTPLVDPSLLGIPQLSSGLVVLLMQYLVMMGMFFTMPLFLSIVLGLDAFETGLRMLPLSLALVVTAPALPRLFPRAGVRLVTTVGLFFMLAATLLLATRFDYGAGADVTTLPFLLMGVGMGALASQLGNVIVSAVPVERGGEAGGLQYTARNLGSSLGTALIGSVVIASMGTLFVSGLEASGEFDALMAQATPTQISSGVDFVPVAELEIALASTSLSADEQLVVLEEYTAAQYGALSRGMAVLSILVVLTLLLAQRLPRRSLIPTEDDEPDPDSAPASVAV
jgi:EmrB/QacA subfamily drug resistance transporter